MLAYHRGCQVDWRQAGLDQLSILVKHSRGEGWNVTSLRVRVSQIRGSRVKQDDALRMTLLPCGTVAP